MNKAFEKIIENLEEAKSNVPVNRLLDDIIKDKPKELGQLMAYNKAIEIVKQEADQYNNGWTPCSEQLPKEDEKVYISTKTERVYVGVYTKRYGFEKREGFICDDGFMWMNTALAWKPYVLPDPYKPKGEIDECRNG